METEKFTSFLQFFFGERKVDRVDCLFVLELKGLCHTALYTGTLIFSLNKVWPILRAVKSAINFLNRMLLYKNVFSLIGNNYWII
jgi:hypothetical protein